MINNNKNDSNNNNSSIYIYDILFFQQLLFLRVVAGFPASRPLRVSYVFAQVETIAFMPQRKLLLGSVNHGKSYGKPSHPRMGFC